MAIDKVTTGVIADDAVTTAKIVNDAVTAGKIVVGAVVADVANDSITAAHLADGAIDHADKIASGVVTNVKLGADAVDGTKMADNAVNSEHVAAGAIDTAHVGNDQITGAKIENNPTIAGNLAVTGNTTVTGDIVPSTPLSYRNVVINGGMTVAQRGNGAGTATGGSGFYQTADRMFDFNNCVAANVTRETTNGVLGTEATNTFNDVFRYSWKWASNGTVASLPSADRVIFIYKMEGQDVQHLAKGTSAAKAVTLSFWVKSTLTGNHQVIITDNINTRQIGAVYAISAANTWEKKVITFAGDTTGAITNDITNGMSIEWWLTAGSTYSSGAVPTSWEASAAGDRAVAQQNYVGGSGRTWQITGIQLELGSNATPFEHRSFGDELVKCMRYYEKTNNYDRKPGTSGGDQAQGMMVYREGYSGSARRDISVNFKVNKRALPTMKGYAPNGTADKVNSPNGPNTTNVVFDDIGNSGCVMYAQPTSGSYWQGHWTAISEL